MMEKKSVKKIIACFLAMVVFVTSGILPEKAFAATKIGTVDPMYNDALYISVTTTGGNLFYTGGVRHPDGVDVCLQNMPNPADNRKLQEGRDFVIDSYVNDVKAYEFTLDPVTNTYVPYDNNAPTVKVMMYFSDGSSALYEAYYEIKRASVQDAYLSQETFVVPQNSTVPDPIPNVKVNGRWLSENVDFVVSYINRSSGAASTSWSSGYAVGYYDILITGIGNYTGTCKKASVRIINAPFGSKNLGRATIIFKKKSRTYYFNPNKPVQPAITVKFGKKKLKKGKHYTIQYSANTAAGTARLAIIATSDGGYNGSLTADYTILPLPLSKCRVRGLQKKTYSAAAATSVNGITLPKLKLTYGGTTLANGTDYTVTYSNNTSAGTATVSFNGDVGSGNYTGAITKKYTIKRKKLTLKNADVTMTYADGTPIANIKQIDASKGEQPTVVGIADHTTGLPLARGVDYSVSYKNYKAKYRDATFEQPDPPTIIIKGKGNYKFTMTIKYLMKGA